MQRSTVRVRGEIDPTLDILFLLLHFFYKKKSTKEQPMDYITFYITCLCAWWIKNVCFVFFKNFFLFA